MQYNPHSPRSTGFGEDKKESDAVAKQKKRAPVLVILLLMCIVAIGTLAFFAIKGQVERDIKRTPATWNNTPRNQVNLYKIKIGVGEFAGAEDSDRYFIYAGMLNDSVYTLVPGIKTSHMGRYNLYYSTSSSQIRVSGLRLNVIEVTPEHFHYDIEGTYD